MSIELQRLDANCNNCKFMVRDFERFEKSVEFQHKMQLDYFNTIKGNLIKKAKWWRDKKNDLEKWDTLLTEAEKMKFQFDKSVIAINYGNCSKLNKQVTFIPNTLQLETQGCFIHRKD